MPNYCPSCAAALEPDAKFCPACSAPVAQSAPANPYAGQQGAGGYGAQPARAMGQYQPSMSFDPFLIAGVLSLFWTMWFFTLSLSSSSLTYLSAAGRFAGEGDVVLAMLASAFYVVAFAIFAMTTYGVFTRKRWAESLAKFGGGAAVVVWAILTIILLIKGGASTGVTVLTIFGVLAGVALVGLLIWSLMRISNQFTNP